MCIHHKCKQNKYSGNQWNKVPNGGKYLVRIYKGKVITSIRQLRPRERPVREQCGSRPNTLLKNKLY